MEYLIKASALIMLFYLCYKFLFSKETFFESNRWFLLAGIITSCVLPFVVIPNYVLIEPQVFNSEFLIGSTIAQSLNAQDSFDFTLLLPYLYLGVVFILSGRFIVQITTLLPFLFNKNHIKEAGFKLISTAQNIPPFSFFNNIIFNPNQFNNQELKQIITHEKVHARELHSIDILLTEIACILFWFNPIIWFYKKDLQQNLEFIADRKAQEQTQCKKSYQHLLLKTSAPNYNLALTNNFYNSLIKKRIVMLHKSKSNKSKAWKYTLILPLLAIFLMSFNTKDIYIETNDSKSDFIITENSTNDDLKAIEYFFKSKNVKVKFTNLKRNGTNQIQRISLNTKYPNDSRYAKRLTLNEGLKETKIKPFQLVYNSDNKDIKFQIRNENSPTSTIQKDNITFSLDATVSNLNEIEIEDRLINKDFTDAQLDNLKKEMAAAGLVIKFKGVKRNSKNEIIAIKIDAKSKNSNANFSVSDDTPIETIKISFDTESNSISIGNVNALHHGNDFVYEHKDGNVKVKKLDKGNSVFVYSSDENHNGKHEVIEDEDKIIISTKGEVQEIKKDHKNKTVFVIADDDKKVIKEWKDKDGAIFIHSSDDEEDNDNTIILKSKNGSKTSASASGKGTKILFGGHDEKPLFVVDGKEMTEAEMKDLDPNDIASINVIKGEAATKKYGEKAKDGVIEITTKKKE